MKKVLQIIEHIIVRICDLGLLISGILILIMALASTYGVGRRYLLNNPEPYSYELSTMLLVACLVFAVAGLQRRKTNLKVDFISNLFPANIQGIITDIVIPLLALFFAAIITWQSWNNTLYSLRIGETSQSSWEEPLFPIKLVVPIGMGLLCLVLVTQLCRGIASLIAMIRKK